MKTTQFTQNLITPRERAWNFESILKIWGLNSQAFSHNEILYFVGLESVRELIRSSDDHRSYFLLSGSQDFADFLGKKIQFVQFTKMRISHEPFELHPWFFARKQTLPREIRRKNLVFWRLVQPAQPAQPTYQMKKWKSGITFEWVCRFGWNFAWKLLKSIYITSIKKSLAEQIFTALPNQPKMVLIEIFWKFMKFLFFSMKHPHTIAFKHNLGKKYSHIDFFATICLILYCFVYKICLIKLNLHEKWAQLTKFFYGFVYVTSSAIQWCIVLLNLNH